MVPEAIQRRFRASTNDYDFREPSLVNIAIPTRIASDVSPMLSTMMVMRMHVHTFRHA